MNIILHNRLPTWEEYHHLCASVGWEPVINFEAARLSLPRSLFGVVAEADGQIVGMGRIVGDGAIYFYLQDIAVQPEYQGRGLGKRILARLLDYLRENAPEKAFVGLFASEGAGELYQKFGFITHPALTGMFQTTPLKDQPEQ